MSNAPNPEAEPPRITLAALSTSVLLAVIAAITTTLLVASAIAATLVTAHLPGWTALWIVATIAGAITAVLVAHARTLHRVMR